MFSHINIGISDFGRAYRFYAGLMEMLGHRLRFSQEGESWAAWQPADADRPLLLIARPFDGQAATPGNGGMVALLAASRAIVDRAHAYALAQGGVDEGAPGLRLRYHKDYYGAYFRDLDGNKLCVVCHAAES